MVINSAFKQMIAKSDSKNAIRDTLNHYRAIIAIKLIVDATTKRSVLKIALNSLYE